MCSRAGLCQRLRPALGGLCQGTERRQAPGPAGPSPAVAGRKIFERRVPVTRWVHRCGDPGHLCIDRAAAARSTRRPGRAESRSSIRVPRAALDATRAPSVGCPLLTASGRHARRSGYNEVGRQPAGGCEEAHGGWRIRGGDRPSRPLPRCVATAPGGLCGPRHMRAVRESEWDEHVDSKGVIAVCAAGDPLASRVVARRLDGSGRRQFSAEN